jgi:hypothetical protein
MPLFVPVFCNVNAPVAVIAAPAVMLPLLAASVSENIAPVDAALTFADAESVM